MGNECVSERFYSRSCTCHHKHSYGLDVKSLPRAHCLNTAVLTALSGKSAEPLSIGTLLEEVGPQSQASLAVDALLSDREGLLLTPCFPHCEEMHPCGL